MKIRCPLKSNHSLKQQFIYVICWLFSENLLSDPINLLNLLHSVSDTKLFYILVPRALNQTHPKQR